MPLRGNRRPGRPPGANVGETRQLIIEAARRVFSERGYDGTTFQEIAARADLSRPAVNHYFSGKARLYREVLDVTNTSVIGAGIKQAEHETMLVARMTAFVSGVVRANSAGPGLLITSILESQRHPEWNRTENASVRISREFLMRIVNDAIERREIAADTDASSLVEMLLVVLYGVGVYVGYVHSDQERLAVDMVRQLLEGMRWQSDR
ncbi:TetR/AcrR family transcriptional regulator [Mycobacterium intracellulare]|uniref:TetR/AcrR family transcriptional regulator n=1 Tax=Mycobacterium intracellulare TaxID=1767 RepID=UPI003558259C